MAGTGGVRRAWLLGALAVGAAGLGTCVGVVASATARADQPAAACLLLCPAPTTPTTSTATVSPPTGTATTPAPASSSVVAGAAYVGRPRNFSHIITVQVSDNGNHASQFSLQFDHGRCSDGTPYASDWAVKGAWAIRDAAATLSALSAARVGSSAAPLKTPCARTAIYSYHNSSGSIEMDVFVPLHMISWLRAKWTFACPNEKPLHQTSWVYDIPLNGNDDSTSAAFIKTQQEKDVQTVDGRRVHLQQYAHASGFLMTTERGAYEGESVTFSGGIGLVGAAAPLCSGLTRGTARTQR